MDSDDVRRPTRVRAIYLGFILGIGPGIAIDAALGNVGAGIAMGAGMAIAFAAALSNAAKIKET